MYLKVITPQLPAHQESMLLNATHRTLAEHGVTLPQCLFVLGLIKRKEESQAPALYAAYCAAMDAIAKQYRLKYGPTSKELVIGLMVEPDDEELSIFECDDSHISAGANNKISPGT